MNLVSQLAGQLISVINKNRDNGQHIKIIVIRRYTDGCGMLPG